MRNTLISGTFFAASVLGFWGCAPSVFAANDNYRTENGADLKIDEYNICKHIKSTGVQDVFVPTKTVTEWKAFLNNPPSGVTLLSNCSAEAKLTGFIPTTEEIFSSFIDQSGKVVIQETSGWHSFWSKVDDQVRGGLDDLDDHVLHPIGEFVSDSVDFVVDKVKLITTAIIDVGGDIIDGLQDLANGIWNGITHGDWELAHDGLRKLLINVPVKALGYNFQILGISDLLNIDASKLVYNGDSLRKIDILFLVDSADGEDLALQAASYYGENRGIFSFSPFKESKGSFNLWYKKKSLNDNQINGSDSVIFLESLVSMVLPQADFVIILSDENFRSFANYFGPARVSTTYYPAYYWSSDNRFEGTARTSAHEFGHSFAALHDEYVELGKKGEPGKPNCAPDLATAKSWWGSVKDIDITPGCGYSLNNFRPYKNSIMRQQFPGSSNDPGSYLYYYDADPTYRGVNEAAIRYYLDH